MSAPTAADQTADHAADQAAAQAAGTRLRGEAALLAELQARRTPGVTARAYLESVRAELYQRHLAGASGTEIVIASTQAMDDLIKALFRYADDEHARKRTLPRLNQRLAIVARGGYGRAELNVAVGYRPGFSPRLEAGAVPRDRGRNHSQCALGCRA